MENVSTNRKKKFNWKQFNTVAITVVVCAIIAALGYYHVMTVRKSYLKGVSDGMGITNVQGLLDVVNK